MDPDRYCVARCTPCWACANRAGSEGFRPKAELRHAAELDAGPVTGRRAARNSTFVVFVIYRVIWWLPRDRSLAAAADAATALACHSSRQSSCSNGLIRPDSAESDIGGCATPKS